MGIFSRNADDNVLDSSTPGFSSHSRRDLAGLSWSRSGWILHSWNLGTRTRWFQSGLPIELVLDRLEALNITLPVYVLDYSTTNSEAHMQLRALATALQAARPACSTVLRKV